MVGQELITPSEKIIAKLKKLKDNPCLKDEKEILEDIDWYEIKNN
jgi:hypothetical protein